MNLTPIRTGDGSFTIFSSQYKEHYHSLSEGAFKESLYKHIIPAFEYVEKRDELNILDICFGIGFNTLTTIYYAKSIGFSGKINIYSPELNEDLIHSLNLLPYPQEFLENLDVISGISKESRYKDKDFSVEVFIGDACEYVKTFQEKFDIIYQDAFSSKKNPELWSEEFFRSLYLSMRDGGILTTYSQAKGVRAKMQNAGFRLDAQQIDESLGIRSGTLGLK